MDKQSPISQSTSPTTISRHLLPYSLQAPKMPSSKESHRLKNDDKSSNNLWRNNSARTLTTITTRGQERTEINGFKMRKKTSRIEKGKERMRFKSTMKENSIEYPAGLKRRHRSPNTLCSAHNPCVLSTISSKTNMKMYRTSPESSCPLSNIHNNNYNCLKRSTLHKKEGIIFHKAINRAIW